MRGKSYSKICTTADVNTSSRGSPASVRVSQVGKCTTIRETVTSRHHDGVSFPHDSSIILVEIHIDCKIVFTNVSEYCMFSVVQSLDREICIRSIHNPIFLSCQVTRVTRQRDTISSTHDSFIILAKIHVKCVYLQYNVMKKCVTIH